MVKVSAIIPNYNYARFLKRRLDSIALQTVRPDELIFLDDCSTDNSLQVAADLLNTYDIPYQIVPNEKNQGVFSQWLKGIGLAHYDYIWIAEADDYCELHFLETLLSAFDDEDVILSYCLSKKVDAQGLYLGTHVDDMANFIDVTRWHTNFTNTCYDEASNYLAILCTLANVSSVILDKKRIPIPKLLPVTQYKMAGDWLFYLITLFENPNLKISYCAEGLNYWCQHTNSVWGAPNASSKGIKENLRVFISILESYEIAKKAKIAIFELINKNYFVSADDDLADLLSRVLYLLGSDTEELLLQEFVHSKLMKHQEHLQKDNELARLHQECSNRDKEIARLMKKTKWRFKW